MTDTTTDDDTLTVDIWSDVMCPWCAIGVTQFLKAVELLDGDIKVSMRFMPFELAPDMAAEGKGQSQHLADSYGRSLEQVEAMSAKMAAMGAQAGFSMEYSGSKTDDGKVPTMMTWNSHDAHKLLRWALSARDEAAQVELKMALFRAHFQERRNMSDRSVLLDIAEGQGFDRTAAAEALADEALAIAVRSDEERARNNQINSVPTFVVNGRYILEGANEPENFKSALYKLANMEAQA